MPTSSSNSLLPNSPAITSLEPKALTELLGGQHPFSTSMDQLFADDKTKGNGSVTLPQLVTSRNPAEYTTGLIGDEAGAYSRAEFLERLSATAQDISHMSEPSLILPHLYEFREPLNFIPYRGSLIKFQPFNLDPTVRKRNQLELSREQNDTPLSLEQVNNIKDLPSAKVKQELPYTVLRNEKNQQDNYEYENYKSIKSHINKIGNNIRIKHEKLNIAGDVRSGNYYNSFNMVPESNDEDESEIDYSNVRLEVKGTRAEGNLSANWFFKYRDYTVGKRYHLRTRLERVLQGEILERARHYFEEFPQILKAPVCLHEDIRDKILGTIRENNLSPTNYEIAINGRYFMDPEDITFIIVEEAEHMAQLLRGMHIDNSKPYEERPHEILAKAMAFKITGFRPATHQFIQTREHYTALLKKDTPK